MVKKFLRLLILLPLFAVSAETKSVLKLVQESPHGNLEQVAIVVQGNKAQLILNSNRWTEQLRLGVFESLDPKVILALKSKINSFASDGVRKAKGSAKHVPQVYINQSLLNDRGPQHRAAIQLVRDIFKRYDWRPVDELSLKGNKVISSKSHKRFKLNECVSGKGGSWTCTGEYGVLHLKEHPLLNLHKKN